MYVGVKEQAIVGLTGIALCLAILMLYPWWMAAAAFVVLAPLFMQVRRMGSRERKAARPSPK